MIVRGLQREVNDFLWFNAACRLDLAFAPKQMNSPAGSSGQADPDPTLSVPGAILAGVKTYQSKA